MKEGRERIKEERKKEESRKRKRMEKDIRG